MSVTAANVEKEATPEGSDCLGNIPFHTGIKRQVEIPAEQSTKKEKVKKKKPDSA